MRLGVLKEGFKLPEGVATLLHHTLVHLKQGEMSGVIMAVL